MVHAGHGQPPPLRKVCKPSRTMMVKNAIDSLSSRQSIAPMAVVEVEIWAMLGGTGKLTERRQTQTIPITQKITNVLQILMLKPSQRLNPGVG